MLVVTVITYEINVVTTFQPYSSDKYLKAIPSTCHCVEFKGNDSSRRLGNLPPPYAGLGPFSNAEYLWANGSIQGDFDIPINTS